MSFAALLLFRVRLVDLRSERNNKSLRWPLLRAQLPYSRSAHTLAPWPELHTQSYQKRVIRQLQ